MVLSWLWPATSLKAIGRRVFTRPRPIRHAIGDAERFVGRSVFPVESCGSESDASIRGTVSGEHGNAAAAAAAGALPDPGTKWQGLFYGTQY